MVSFSVEFEQKELLQPYEMRECKTIYDVKKLIEKKKNFSIASQILSFENYLVPDNFKIDDIPLK